LENVLNNEELAKRFLLGNVSESERAAIEDGFLAPDDSYQQLLIAEDDLIDAYVRGELHASERELFERWLLASQNLRERVEFAQTLFNSVSGKAVPARVPDRPVSWWRSLARAFVSRRPALAFAFAAALLVIVLGGLWLLTERRRTRPSSEQAKAIQPTPVTPRESSTPNAPAEAQQARNEERTPARETPTRPAPVIATFTLVPGLVRGENGAGALALPAGATEVRLRLTLEGERYQKYRATLSTPEGRTVWSIEVTNGPSMKSTHLTASIPADLLKNGDYVLDLSGAKPAGGWESVADYSFRIVKK
jgi:hypothetical protein